MGRPKEDFPPLLPLGEHPHTVAEIRSMCVDAFPLSATRAEIMRGFERMHAELLRLEIPCDIVFDGSFLTEEIDPDDADFTVVVSGEFYDSCGTEQRAYLDWIGNDRTIKETYLCDSYLCVEYPPGHPEGYGLVDRTYWINVYARSIIYRRERGVVLIRVA